MTQRKTKREGTYRLGYDRYHELLMLMKSKRASWETLRAKTLCERIARHGYHVKPTHVYRLRASLGWVKLRKPKLNPVEVRNNQTWSKIRKLQERIKVLESQLEGKGAVMKMRKLLKIAGIA